MIGMVTRDDDYVTERERDGRHERWETDDNGGKKKEEKEMKFFSYKPTSLLRLPTSFPPAREKRSFTTMTITRENEEGSRTMET